MKPTIAKSIPTLLVLDRNKNNAKSEIKYELQSMTCVILLNNIVRSRSTISRP